MDVSKQLRDLANTVSDDFALNAPDDASKLVGRARRGRMVWTTGVGTAVVGSAASLLLGGPALASVLTTTGDVAPVASTTPSPVASAVVTPSPSVSPVPVVTPQATATPGAGFIDLTGGAGASLGDDDDESDDDESDDDESDDDSSDDDESADDSSDNESDDESDGEDD